MTVAGILSSDTGFHGDVLPILLVIAGVFIVGLVILAVLGWQESKDDFF